MLFWGFRIASALAQEALATGRSVCELALERGLITREQLSALLDVERLVRQGVEAARAAS